MSVCKLQCLNLTFRQLMFIMLCVLIYNIAFTTVALVLGLWWKCIWQHCVFLINTGCVCLDMDDHWTQCDTYFNFQFHLLRYACVHANACKPRQLYVRRSSHNLHPEQTLQIRLSTHWPLLLPRQEAPFQGCNAEACTKKGSGKRAGRTGRGLYNMEEELSSSAI